MMELHKCRLYILVYMYDEVSTFTYDRRYRTNTYFKILDRIILSMNLDLVVLKIFLKIYLLYLLNMKNDNKSIPEDNFHNLSN